MSRVNIRLNRFWRFGEGCVCLLMLLVCAPILACVALAVVIESGVPVLFVQTRIGCHGSPFQLFKIRTMRLGQKGSSITSLGDRRITRIGKFIRKYKLDELPQLWNVVRGDMSLVGPRPEIPQFVDLADPVWRSVLAVRPGITDPASIAYRDEEVLLATASDPIRFYKEKILPDKLARNLEYLQTRSVWSDITVIAETIRAVLLPARSKRTSPDPAPGD